MKLRDESVATLLKGRAVEVSVGEPWDFESSVGQNRLEGKILSVMTKGEQSVRLRVTPFASKAGKEVTELVATARYTEDVSNLIEQLADGQKISANLSYHEQVPEHEMPEGSSPFLIGGLHLVD